MHRSGFKNFHIPACFYYSLVTLFFSLLLFSVLNQIHAVSFMCPLKNSYLEPPLHKVNASLARYTAPNGYVLKSLVRAVQYEKTSFSSGANLTVPQVKVVVPSHDAPTASKKRKGAQDAHPSPSSSDDSRDGRGDDDGGGAAAQSRRADGAEGEARPTAEQQQQQPAPAPAGGGGSKPASKMCPICKKTFSCFGFHMHTVKCKKFLNWACEWCGVADISVFAPRLPGPGPGGEFSLCPSCSDTYTTKEKIVTQEKRWLQRIGKSRRRREQKKKKR